MTVTPPEDFPQLGRYQIINKIASGGMAEVFLARAVGAMGFQRLVAVKLIHANFTRDSDFVKMFIDEARIAMHLHHRNIVQVFDLDQLHDTYFIAMEFVHGVNVYDLYEAIAAKNRWVDVSLALYIVAEVCKGLHFAHTRVGPDGRPMNIVHRDISPQNVLLSFEGEVKITDFGIATAAERLHQTAAGIVKGKYAYMAPERLEDQKVDGRVDVFAAGVGRVRLDEQPGDEAHHLVRLLLLEQGSVAFLGQAVDVVGAESHEPGGGQHTGGHPGPVPAYELACPVAQVALAGADRHTGEVALNILG